MTGPYIITTRQPDERTGPSGEQSHVEFVSRLAVATLEEARKVPFFGHDVATPENWADLTVALMELPESGGTISLPDGTVIEVEQVSLYDLDPMWTTKCEAWSMDRVRRTCDAYNAQQKALA